MVRLSVNIDHVATLRQARRAPYPDPVEAARLAEEAGASGITAHLRVDRRHIQDEDLERLRQSVSGKLNFELSTAEEMVALALKVRPDQVTLVPERPEEITTEGGLDLLARGEQVTAAAAALARAGLAVSLFIDPDPRQIEALERLSGSAAVAGVELNTDAYTKASRRAATAARRELAQVAAAAELAADQGRLVYAGHGLTTGNVGAMVAAVSQVEELNIGHFLISRAVLVGLGEAVREMTAAMAAGEAERTGRRA